LGKEFKIINDPEYGYLRVDPLPTDEEVNKFYKEEFYSSEYKNFNDSSLEVQKEEKDFFDSRWESVYKHCEGYFHDMTNRSIFDIGFGFAQALLYLENKGLEVSGLDPAPEGVDYARSKGLEVYLSEISDFGCVGDKRFDIVTMFNVLEHLRKPAKTLLDIKEKLLKPDGVVVIDVPNEFNDFQITANKEYNLNEWWVCPPAHINYFSVTSVLKLLDKCGYKEVLSESSFPLEMFLVMGDVFVGNGALGKICHQKRVKFEYLMNKHGKGGKLSQFYQALAKLDLGRQVVVYATPR
jgi:2-polyprenyl-3-methyl-5-hydroxy-6-metoxy-1,4-benzoquinol methylase